MVTREWLEEEEEVVVVALGGTGFCGCWTGLGRRQSRAELQPILLSYLPAFSLLAY